MHYVAEQIEPPSKITGGVENVPENEEAVARRVSYSAATYRAENKPDEEITVSRLHAAPLEDGKPDRFIEFGFCIIFVHD